MRQNEIQGMYGVGWHFFRVVFRTYFRYRIYHPERVPMKGPVIIAANHASYLDPPLVGCGVNRMLSMLARASLFRFPVFGPLLRSWHAVPVDSSGPGASGLKCIIRMLQSDAAILMFPEGERNLDGKTLPVQAGLGLVILKSNAIVVPARVWGTHEAYGRLMKYPLPLPVSVKYGHPISFEAERKLIRSASRDERRLAYQAASERVMKSILKLEPCRDKAVFP